MTARRGHTLIELTIVVTILAVLAVAAVPSYRRAAEQTRVDSCASALRTLWSAQRAHWLEHRSYAETFDTLADEGFTDRASFAGTDSFELRMSDVTETTFLVTATRLGSVWEGTVTVDETGLLIGATHTDGGDVVVAGSR